MRLGIIIPAFNAGTRVKAVIRGAKFYTTNIVVIDDGSTDNTREVAHTENVHVLSHPQNLGKG